MAILTAKDLSFAYEGKTVLEGVSFSLSAGDYLCVVGENGSGKSNLGLALFDLVNHLTQKFKKDNYYNSFTFGGDLNLNVQFEYTFKFGTQIIEYQYKKNASGILVEESLLVDGIVSFNRKRHQLELDEEQFPIDPNAKSPLTLWMRTQGSSLILREDLL